MFKLDIDRLHKSIGCKTRGCGATTVEANDFVQDLAINSYPTAYLRIQRKNIWHIMDIVHSLCKHYSLDYIPHGKSYTIGLTTVYVVHEFDELRGVDKPIFEIN